MRRTTQSNSWTALAVLVVVAVAIGAGLLAWLSADTANPSSMPVPLEGTGESSRVDGARPPPRTEGFSIHAALESSSSATLVTTGSWPEATSGPRASPALVDAQESGEAAPGFSRPPLSVSEIAADGIPVEGLRCTYDGGTFTCGGCRTDGDCPAGQGCVANRETRRFECMASECEEDTHCFPGFVCRRVGGGSTGPTLIRRCVPEGVRQEGEHCDTLPILVGGGLPGGAGVPLGPLHRPLPPG